ncbi:hypothetical protein [Alienimonas chondri]|uniref:Secreted protein n=1 Tax=Alienimonas chondri TaxID=2681879 RepID=A0ABX1VC55_9PLAN|nr:hypothetical protein [Alienimonas chondri]NNJ25663.1 hypothetical protein [Alienimonas chondri]
MRPFNMVLGPGLLGIGFYFSLGAVASLPAQTSPPPGGPTPLSRPAFQDGPVQSGTVQSSPVQGGSVQSGPADAGGTITRGDDLRAADPGSWDHVDLMAERLEHLSKQLHDEVHAHLQGHEYFRHMDGHATEVERLATHLHAVAHAGESIPHLRADVVALDTQVHEADEVITQIARRGVLTRHYNGAIVQTRRIVREMIAIQHHLEEDLAVLDPNHRNYRQREAARPVPRDPHDHGPYPGPVHTPPSWHAPGTTGSPLHPRPYHDDYHDHHRHVAPGTIYPSYPSPIHGPYHHPH